MDSISRYMPLNAAHGLASSWCTSQPRLYPRSLAGFRRSRRIDFDPTDEAIQHFLSPSGRSASRMMARFRLEYSGEYRGFSIDRKRGHFPLPEIG